MKLEQPAFSVKEFLYTTPLKRSLFTLTALFLTFSACSSTQVAADGDEPERNLTDLEALYWERIENSRMNFTQADVDFMTDMIVHHAQALIMSRLAPENDASHSVQTLAARIINAQDDEIAAMQKWLRDRGQPVPLVHIEDLVLMIHMEESGEDEGHNSMDHSTHQDSDHHHTSDDHHTGHHDMDHHHDMPGMLTQDQLDYLATLNGTEFDRTFLEFMIEHHEGAVYMVQELFAADGAANDNEAFELASDIHAEQITEINRMKLMIENMNN